jgi:hypothetical protein
MIIAFALIFAFLFLQDRGYMDDFLGEMTYKKIEK